VLTRTLAAYQFSGRFRPAKGARRPRRRALLSLFAEPSGGGRSALRMKRLVWPITAFLFPFLYYFRFVVPNSSLLVIENDFDFLYYRYKAYLVDLMAHGHFPWWSPAEAAGYSFFGNPFTAPIYPLNVVPLLVRLAVGNYNAWFHQIFTIFGVSLFALGLYRWLHRLYGKPHAALFASAVISTCWSISGFVRFPNAIHAIAWVPWVLAALHAAHVQPRSRAVYFGMAALFCEITAGYPYFVVYSFFLYAAYLVYLHLTLPTPDWKHRLVRQLFLLITPVLLVAPYVSAVSAVTKVTRNRAGGDFGYGSAYDYGVIDLVGSFIFPPVVTVEGCIYPGLFALFLIVLYFWRYPSVSEKVGVLVGFVGLLSVIMDYHSYVFTPVWSFLPIVNQMRAFARMTIITLPILAVALHQGYVFFAGEIERKLDERTLTPRAAWLVFAPVLVIQYLLYSVREGLHKDYMDWLARFLPSGSHEFDFLMTTVFTFVVVLCVLSFDWSQIRHGRELALAFAIFIATLDTGMQGRYWWSRSIDGWLSDNGIAADSGSLVQRAWTFTKRKANFFRLVHDYFALDRFTDQGAAPWPGNLGITADGLSALPTPDFDFESYWKFHEHTKPEDLHRLMGKQKLFFGESIHDDAPDFLADVDAHAKKSDPPTIEYFDGSELRFRVKTTEPGFLTWIDNFDAGWSARVDGSRVPIQRSMTTFKAVRLPAAGDHTVRFVYRPVISTVAYVLMGFGLLAPGALALWERRHRRLLELRPTLARPSSFV
jgi:hypothetical protein